MESPEQHIDPSKRFVWLKRIVYFFPFQLVLLHLKRNHLLMIFWMLLFLYVTNMIGSKYGISYLFLAPEYLGEINWLSFGILGFSLGGFLMAFNIYSYILHANEFQFLATLSRPFLKFCYNNLIIPIFFYVLILVKSFYFQIDQELFPAGTALFNLFAFSIGIFVFLLFSMIFFVYFNKNIFKMSGKDESYYDTLSGLKAKESTFIKETNWYSRMSRKRKWRVDTYIFSPISIKLTRDTSHYDKKMLKEVFTQNHINASIFEVVLIISFLIVGIFRDVDWMNIPAAASIILLFTLFLLIFSALYSWFKGWTLTLIIGLLLLLNYASNNSNALRFRNYAYGIDYSESAPYTWKHLKELSSDTEAYNNSMSEGIKILENWKSKNKQKRPLVKPKLILLNISGGGLRAGMWTVELLGHLDSVTQGAFFEQTQLITGASGGMIGATYFRELYLQRLSDSTLNLNDSKYSDNMGEDLLNPLAFGIATTDFLFRYQKFEDGKYTYTKDRGYSFEQKLIENLDGNFQNKRLGDYWKDEYSGTIPMMIYSPSVVNDGRRMLISPQAISYLTYNNDSLYTSTYPSMENVEFTKLFQENDPYNLRITSAMRMSATFPYILPMVTVPTDPPIELMDAGIRDNYGLKTSLYYLRVFRNWISTNTSGVIVVQIRDKQKMFEVENPNNGTVMQRLFAPFGSFYSNTTKSHDYNNDQLLKSVPDWYSGNFDVLTFYMNQDENRQISMSWHLTSKDKEAIRNAIKEEDNQKSLLKLKSLLDVK